MRWHWGEARTLVFCAWRSGRFFDANGPAKLDNKPPQGRKRIPSAASGASNQNKNPVVPGASTSDSEGAFRTQPPAPYGFAETALTLAGCS